MLYMLYGLAIKDLSQVINIWKNTFIKIHQNIEINITYSSQFSTVFLLGLLDLDYDGNESRTVYISN